MTFFYKIKCHQSITLTISSKIESHQQMNIFKRMYTWIYDSFKKKFLALEGYSCPLNF